MKKWSTRDVVIFLFGVEAFHTLTHILISYADVLPLQIVVNWTPGLNVWAIVINGIITLGLGVWLTRLK